ncbi:MAG: hypothetical protein ACR2JW_05365 [Thermomicrobiales bacterium]
MSNLFTQRCDALWVEDALTHEALTIFPLSGVRHGYLAYTLFSTTAALHEGGWRRTQRA